MAYILIIWLSIIWIAPLVILLQINEAKWKKNIVVGVTFPQEARENPEVLTALANYRKQSLLIMWLLLAAGMAGMVVGLMIPNKFGLNMMLWGIWLIGCIILPYVPYVRTNSALKQIKKKHGYGRKEGRGEGHEEPASAPVLIDLSAMPSDRWISPWVFLPAVLIAACPALFEKSLWPIYLVMAGTCVLFWVAYRYLYRNRSERVDENVELTKALTALRRRNWGRIWLASTWLTAIYSLLIWLFSKSPAAVLILTILYSILVCAIVLWLEMETRRQQAELTKQSGTGQLVDEDDYWIGGIFYHNPDDSRLIINYRVGNNTTVNLAKTSGKVLMLAVLAILLIIPFTGLWLDAESTNPITLAVSDLTETSMEHEQPDLELVASSGMTTYRVPLDQIVSVEKLTELPDMVRSWGTAMPGLDKGNWAVIGYGSVKVLIDPTTPPFLMIKDKTGQWWLFGTRTPELTERVYQCLPEKK